MQMKQFFQEILIPAGQLLELYRTASIGAGNQTHALRCEEWQDTLNLTAAWAASRKTSDDSRSHVANLIVDLNRRLTTCMSARSTDPKHWVLARVLKPALPSLSVPVQPGVRLDYVSWADVVPKELRTSVHQAIGYRAEIRGKWVELLAASSYLARQPARWRTLVRNTDWSDTLLKLGVNPKADNLGERLTQHMGSGQGRALLPARWAELLGEDEAAVVTPLEDEALPPGLTVEMALGRKLKVTAEFKPGSYVGKKLMGSVGPLPEKLRKALTPQTKELTVPWRELPTTVESLVQWQKDQVQSALKLAAQLEATAETNRLAALKAKFEATFSEEDRKLLAQALTPAKAPAKRKPSAAAKKKAAA